jgi:hypothetical protein
LGIEDVKLLLRLGNSQALCLVEVCQMETTYNRSMAEQFDELADVGDDCVKVGEEDSLAVQRLLTVRPGGFEEQPGVPVRHARYRDALFHRVGHRLLDPRHQRLDYVTGKGDVHHVTLLRGRLKLPLTLGLHNHRAAVLADLEKVIDVARVRGRLRFDGRVPTPVQDFEKEAIEHLQPRVGFVRPGRQCSTYLRFELHQPPG